MSTVYSIAKETGLSPSTVARALSGRGYVSKQARDKVMSVANRLDYSPSYIAKVMRTKKTHRVLFCVTSSNIEFNAQLNEAIYRRLGEEDYFCLMNNTDDNDEDVLNQILKMREDIADGTIMVAKNVTRSLIEQINHIGKPAVLINWTDQRLPGDRFHNVYTDVTEGVSIMVRYLIDRGHRNIAFVYGDPNQSTSKTRYHGYCQALNEAGLLLDSKNVFSMRDGMPAAAAFEYIFSLSSRPTAVVFCNDTLAVSFISSCRQHGISVPQDISVVGMMNENISSICYPTLTTYDIRLAELGNTAADLILKTIQGEQKQFIEVRLHGTLIERDSVAVIT